MKKIVISALILVLAAAAVMAQSLLDNEYYKKSKSLEAEAKTAFNNGEYDRAITLAEEAQTNAQLSDEYVAKMLIKYTANDAIKAAEARYGHATKVNAATRYAKEYAEAGTELASAKDAYKAESYEEAITHANKVVELLAGISGELTLPGLFIVRRIPSRPDCFWRIAGLPSVYNDPLKWPILYKANKKLLQDPNNPDLIQPGVKLTIPSIAGEIREGVWDEKQSYPVFQNNKK